jgi:hypothetical protein
MDPRLSPQLNPAHPAAPAPVPESIPAPVSTHPVATTPQPPPQPFKTEIVGAIPLHQPGQTQSAPVSAAPVIQMPDSPAAQPAASEPGQPHDDLDRILQAVNNRVATPQTAPKAKKEIVKKIAGQAAKIKPANKNSKPIGLTIAVIVIAVALSILAVRAYRQTGAAALPNQPGKVGTSYTASGAIQSAGGTLVRPADLDDYSQELQKQLDSLNDSQDFAANSLSDQVLGL